MQSRDTSPSQIIMGKNFFPAILVDLDEISGLAALVDTSVPSYDEYRVALAACVDWKYETREEAVEAVWAQIVLDRTPRTATTRATAEHLGGTKIRYTLPCGHTQTKDHGKGIPAQRIPESACRMMVRMWNSTGVSVPVCARCARSEKR